MPKSECQRKSGDPIHLVSLWPDEGCCHVMFTWTGRGKRGEGGDRHPRNGKQARFGGELGIENESDRKHRQT